MMIWQTALVASLLASGAQASGIAALVAEGMSRNSPSLERRMQEIAKSSILARGYVEERQTTSQSSNTILNPDGSINMRVWDGAANAACNAALKALPQATNPSGTCVCYNLPALDNSTGTFEADLRLYRLGEPTGQFQGIPPSNVQVSLSYRGASVSPVTVDRASQAAVRTVTRRQTNADADLELLQTYLFVGQIDRAQMSQAMTMAQLQALVMPIVTLSANNGQGQKVSTNVSSNEAAFVTGVFSQEVVMSSFRVAELAVEAEIERLRNGTTAFVLPGVQIMIFPVGLVVTGLWTIIGICAYGYGTYNRYNFAEHYRRQMQRAEKGAMARI
ncbi:hypothetical protein B0H67DRAFT_509621 [Lasiosphaeris hirsuta]|uniref:Uncharacterized protein n=1 Tax=Lasiosphaeris hirsuta TaxID=260670 RepID=A0AA40ANY6_9PEZI|nr:hypothetical protein B0H67DRAFT_509621 [Lasiosphaeris hirsuta]